MFKEFLDYLGTFSGGAFRCRICGAWHGGHMPDPNICRECWLKGYR